MIWKINLRAPNIKSEKNNEIISEFHVSISFHNRTRKKQNITSNNEKLRKMTMFLVIF